MPGAVKQCMAIVAVTAQGQLLQLTCVEQQQQSCLKGSEDELHRAGRKVALDMACPQSIHPPQLAVLVGPFIELLELTHAVSHLLR